VRVDRNGMTAPRFSVVIPAYNAAGYVAETIDSLAGQTFRDFETIVVDDRSTDATASVARNRMITHGLPGAVIVRAPDLPKGVSTCRNLGLKAAKGEWIAFLDSDDLFTADKLARIAIALEGRSDAVKAIHHKARRFLDASGETVDITVGDASGDSVRWLFDALLSGNFLTTSTWVIARELLIELGGFNNELHGVEDWWLALRVSKRTPWLFIDAALTHYRIRTASLMTNAAFDHYVRQHLALVRVARASGEITPENLETLHHYCLGPLTQYFAGLSFARRGWRALIGGVRLLVTAGELRAAFDVVWRHIRAQALTQLSRIARLVRAASASLQTRTRGQDTAP
jgi:glycosyltransferase involved in cell wall biosynthesis